MSDNQAASPIKKLSQVQLASYVNDALEMESHYFSLTEMAKSWKDELVRFTKRGKKYAASNCVQGLRNTVADYEKKIRRMENAPAPLPQEPVYQPPVYQKPEHCPPQYKDPSPDTYVEDVTLIEKLLTLHIYLLEKLSRTWKPYRSQAIREAKEKHEEACAAYEKQYKAACIKAEKDHKAACANYEKLYRAECADFKKKYQLLCEQCKENRLTEIDTLRGHLQTSRQRLAKAEEELAAVVSTETYIKEQEKTMQEQAQKIRQLLDRFYSCNVIPPDYRTPDCLMVLRHIFRNDMADTMREAIKIYEERVFRNEVLVGFRNIYEGLGSLSASMGFMQKTLEGIRDNISLVDSDIRNLSTLVEQGNWLQAEAISQTASAQSNMIAYAQSTQYATEALRDSQLRTENFIRYGY